MRFLALILTIVCTTAQAEIFLKTDKEVKEFNELKLKAEKGDAVAQNDIGKWYLSADWIIKYDIDAVKWFRKAAEQGNAEAQFNLGVCYQDGRGVLKDYTEAFQWYFKASRHGLDLAHHNLGVCYADGLGVNKDPVEAYAYYNLAGVSWELAQQKRDELEKNLNATQIQAGQKRSKELQAEIVAKKPNKK